VQAVATREISLKRRQRTPESSEVHVVLESCLASSLQKSKQRCPFRGSRSTPDNDHNTLMGLLRCEIEEVLTIACQEHAIVRIGELEDCFVRCVYRKRLAQQRYIVAQLLE
jgi:hypothetical protein